MAFDKIPVLIEEDDHSFQAVLDDACDRLWEKKVEYSIRRLREMDAVLVVLEKELDDLVSHGSKRAVS
jgi:hypothetical protein